MRDGRLKLGLLTIYNLMWSLWNTIVQCLTLKGPEWLSVIIDCSYLKRQYKSLMGSELNLERPETFSEKIQWLKLYNRRFEFTMMVDKYKVKRFIEMEIGADYVIPLLRVYNNPNDIDLDELPNQFVLKCNHNSEVVIVKDKTTIDKKDLIHKIDVQFNSSHYLLFREWPYKNIQRKIIVEKYMCNASDDILKDYKFFCFGGRAKYCQVISNRSTDETIDFYDREWQHQSFIGLNPDAHSAHAIEKRPRDYVKMLEIADTLAQSIQSPFVRIDLYYINEKIFLVKLLFSHWQGWEALLLANIIKCWVI